MKISFALSAAPFHTGHTDIRIKPCESGRKAERFGIRREILLKNFNIFGTHAKTGQILLSALQQICRVKIADTKHILQAFRILLSAMIS